MLSSELDCPYPASLEILQIQDWSSLGAKIIYSVVGYLGKIHDKCGETEFWTFIVMWGYTSNTVKIYTLDLNPFNS